MIRRNVRFNKNSRFYENSHKSTLNKIRKLREDKKATPFSEEELYGKIKDNLPAIEKFLKKEDFDEIELNELDEDVYDFEGNFEKAFVWSDWTSDPICFEADGSITFFYDHGDNISMVDGNREVIAFLSYFRNAYGFFSNYGIDEDELDYAWREEHWESEDWEDAGYYKEDGYWVKDSNKDEAEEDEDAKYVRGPDGEIDDDYEDDGWGNARDADKDVYGKRPPLDSKEALTNSDVGHFKRFDLKKLIKMAKSGDIDIEHAIRVAAANRWSTYDRSWE